MYHHVMPVTSSLNITPELFEEQLSGLKTNGWKTLDSKEFLYFLQNPKESRKKCVLLTFDDGFVDNYLYAYPILKKYKMKALLFIATDFITDLDIKRENFIAMPHKQMWKIAFSERNYEVMCTWNELKEMESEGVFDIQSHGHTHKIPDFIEKANYAAVENDLFLGQEFLMKYLNKQPLPISCSTLPIFSQIFLQPARFADKSVLFCLLFFSWEDNTVLLLAEYTCGKRDHSLKF